MSKVHFLIYWSLSIFLSLFIFPWGSVVLPMLLLVYVVVFRTRIPKVKPDSTNFALASLLLFPALAGILIFITLNELVTNGYSATKIIIDSIESLSRWSIVSNCSLVESLRVQNQDAIDWNIIFTVSSFFIPLIYLFIPSLIQVHDIVLFDNMPRQKTDRQNLSERIKKQVNQVHPEYKILVFPLVLFGALIVENYGHSSCTATMMTELGAKYHYPIRTIFINLMIYPLIMAIGSSLAFILEKKNG